MTKNIDPELEIRAREALRGVYAPEAAREDAPLSLLKVLAAVFRSRYLVFGVAALGFLIGAFFAVITPNTYLSTGKFMFAGMGSENVATGPSGDRTSEAISQNASYLFTSNDLLLRVVDAVTPEKILQPYYPDSEGASWAARWFHSLQREYSRTKARGTAREDALLVLQKSIEVEHPRLSNVLIVTCLAHGAQLAHDLLETYMQQAVQWHLEKYNDPKVYQEVSNRAEATARALDEWQTKMRQFLEKAQVRDFPAELTAARQRLQLQRQQLQDKQAQTHSVIEQIADLTERSENMPQTIDFPSTPSSGRIAGLTLSINNLMDRRSKIASISQSDPKILDLDNEIKNLQAELDEAKKKAREEKPVMTPGLNPDWTSMRNEIIHLGVKKVELETDVRILEKQVETSQTQADHLNELQFEFEDLQRRLTRAEAERKTAADALDVANHSKELQQGSLSLLRRFEDPSLPSEKEGPNRAKLILGGLFAGLFLGLGLVLVRAVADSTIRERSDLERMDGIAVIGIMPRLDAKNLRRHRALREQGW